MARKDARLTQDQVAEQLGITKGAVSQWESGKTGPRTDLFRRFAEITNKPLDWLMGFGSSAGFGDSDGVSLLYGKLSAAGENVIPVYDYTTVGDNGEVSLGKESLLAVPCPPQLLGVKGVYAILVSSGRMAPRYEEGEIIFIDPTRHVRPDDYIVARLRSDKSGTIQLVIGKLVQHNSRQLAIRQLNPDMTLYYPMDQIISLELIVISSAIR